MNIRRLSKDGGVPAAVALVANTLDEFDEGNVLFLELAVELLGDPFDVEGLLEPGGHFQQGHMAANVEISEIITAIAASLLKSRSPD